MFIKIESDIFILASVWLRAIFEHSVEIFGGYLPAHQINGYSVRSFGSTLVAYLAALLDFGMKW